MFWNWFNIDFDSYAIFSFWDLVDSVLNIHSELGTKNKNKKLGGLHPQTRMLLNWILLANWLSGITS